MKRFTMHRLCLVLFLTGLAGRAGAQINAAFASSVTGGCAPLSQVMFTDLSTGNPTSWLWNFGNGNTSTLQNPTASYPNPGVYTVSLTVSNGVQSDTETKVGYITVFKNPVAYFTLSPADPCVGNTVTFTSASVPGDAPIASWNWDFGDGNVTTTTTGSVTHAYAVANAYPISVIVTDTNGCTDNFDTLLVVTPAPAASFTYSPAFSCTLPVTVTFTNSSVATPSATYSWTFGDGGTSTQASPQHTYTAAGNYFVKLVVTQNSLCRDSIVLSTPITVGGPVITYSQSDTAICLGDSVLFSFASVPFPVAYQWDFGDGTTSSLSPVYHAYAATGTYTATVTAFDGNGCSNTAAGTVSVNPNPVAAFGPTFMQSCKAPFTVQFQDSSSGAVAWSWAFGDGGTSASQNPSHTFTGTGTYTVQLVATNAFGCKDSAYGLVSIVPPAAGMAIVPWQGCVPLTVTFTSTSTAIEPITQYTWNFGAGQGSAVTAVPTAMHTYATAGSWMVSLDIETVSGCLGTYTDSVRAGDHVTPGLMFSDDTVCYGDTIAFTLNAPGANGWYWYFGDGSVDSVNMDPLHFYGNPGTFTVTLVACQNGCCDTLVMPDLITILPPKAEILPTAFDCDNPYTATFINNSIDADSSVWNFGDGTVLSTIASPVTHTYASRGQYTVWLYTWNFTSGCIDSISVGHTVTDPVAAFSALPLQGCYPLNVQFADSSIDASLYHWYYGDGLADTLAPDTVYHTYALPGYYDVTHIVQDIYGCADTLVKPQYIHVYGPVPAIAASPTAGCRPLPVTFTDSTVSEYPVVQYVWTYGDGVTDTLAASPAMHTYVIPSLYTVSLLAIDSAGCTGLVSVPQLIDVTFPMPAISVDTFACRGEVISFNGAATLVAPPATFAWSFGDGTSDTTATPVTTHAYAGDGTYTWQFTVTDRNGCDSVLTGNVLVEHPVAGFMFTENPGCGFNQVVLTDTSTGTAVTGALWTATNGFISTNWPVANANFVNPGTYSVTLISINAAGCTDTAVLSNVIVVPGPTGNMTYVPDSGCVPLQVTFTLSSPNTLYYILDYGDGGLDSLANTVTSVQHTYLNDTTVTPILYMATLLPGGAKCEIPYTFGSITASSSVDAYITVDGDTVSVVELTLGEEVQLSAQSVTPGIVAWNWYPAAGLSSTTVQSPLLTVTGSGYYYVEVEDASGCRGIDSVYVRLIDCNENVKTYNVITPNGDGLNDEFVIKNPCVENFSVIVFNRWGQKVFESTKPAERWRGLDGGGKEMPEGTYYWIVFSGEKKLTGFVQLIRD